MSGPTPAMPVFGDAYLSDTQHLTLEEHGAYWKLLLIAWRTADCALPNDDKRLAMMLGVTAKKWAKLKPVIMAFWRLDNGRWTQKKQTNVRRFVDKKREQNRTAAASRWNGEDTENKGHGASKRTSERKSERISERNASQTQTHKKSSVGKPTAAGAAPEIPVEDEEFDPVKALFDDGVRVLGASGVKETRARSLIGQWRKQFGDDPVAVAIAAADSRGISQPVEWIPKRLATRTPAANGSGRPLSHAEVVLRDLEDRRRPTTVTST